MSYVYQEYPKCLYQRNGLTMEVESEEAEVRMAALGWMTAKQFHTPVVTIRDGEPEKKKKK